MLNGYPREIINRYFIEHVPSQLCRTIGPTKCNIYMSVLFLGDAKFASFKSRLSRDVQAVYPASGVVFRDSVSRSLAPNATDLVAPIAMGGGVYRFDCGCDSFYVGRTEKNPKAAVAGATF